MKWTGVVCGVLVLTALAGCGDGFPGGGSTLTHLAPDNGSRFGGTEVVVHGTNLISPTKVLFDGVEATDVVFLGTTMVRCVTPPGTGGTFATVTLQMPSGPISLPAGYYYIPPPEVTSVEPPYCPPAGGVSLTLRGKGFVDYGAGTNTVKIGGSPATNVVTVDDTTITCVAPPNLGVVDVSVSNANGEGILVGGLRCFPPPQVTSVTPGAGTPLGGTPVTLAGSGFVANGAGANTVAFGGSSATDVVVVDDTTITCKAPAGTGTVDVSVANANGVGTRASGFQYFPPPTLASVTPDFGSANGGAALTLSGTGFVDNGAGANVVTIGGVAAANVMAVDDTTITCDAPALPVGSHTVRVSNANGAAELAGVYRSLISALLASDGSNLYKVDPANGNTTLIGAIGFNIVAMATHPDGTVYACSTSQLFKLDLITGAGTLVANLSANLPQSVADLAFKGTTLYYGTYIGNTGTIDVADGTVTAKNRCPYYYGGVRKSGLHYDAVADRWGFMTYDGFYCFFFDPEVGGYPSYQSGLGTHAVRAIGEYQGTIYGINCQAGTSGGSLSLVKFGAGFTSVSTVGAVGPSLIALTGTSE